MANEVEHNPETQNAGPVNGDEKPRGLGAAKGKRQPACDHPRADLADRHCRDCGAELQPVPVAGIERLIDEHLRELGVIGPDGRPVPAHSAPADPDTELREQFEQYQAAVEEKNRGSFLGFSSTFPTFERFKAAKPERRREALERVGLAPAKSERRK